MFIHRRTQTFICTVHELESYTQRSVSINVALKSSGPKIGQTMPESINGTLHLDGWPSATSDSKRNFSQLIRRSTCTRSSRQPPTMSRKWTLIGLDFHQLMMTSEEKPCWKWTSNCHKPSSNHPMVSRSMSRGRSSDLSPPCSFNFSDEPNQMVLAILKFQSSSTNEPSIKF